MLRREQSRARDSRRHAVHGHARRASGRARREERPRCCGTSNVAEFAHGYSISLAPLVVKDKVIVGVGGGEYGIRGFIAAYDAATGKEAWRFNTIPAPGEPGSETRGAATRWKSGGGSIWVTGSYDPALNLTYWGIGNPGPDFNPAQRPGDNLYTDSVVALDADTGTAAVALPVHAERSLRLGLDAGAGARRRDVAAARRRSC